MQVWQDISERDLVQAWHAAVFAVKAKAGKLPDLRAVIAESRGGAVLQTPEQMERQLVGLSKLHGIPMKPASPETIAALRKWHG